MNELLLADGISDFAKAGLIGVGIGFLFGFFAQRSAFCLRSACIEFWTASAGPKFANWLACFGGALLLTQLVIAAGALDLDRIRQVSTAGTLSGAVIGGAVFGVGMIMARGCASRLLILSATGNMRALLAGLVVTVVAQASLSGVLSPLRNWLSSFWVVGPMERGMANWLPAGSGWVLGGVCLILAGILVRRTGGAWKSAGFAFLVGGSVALGWYLTGALASLSFEIIPVGSVTFTGPSADTLMALITTPEIEPSFNIGLVPGVFIGSFLAAVTSGTFKFQSFDASTGTARYLVGAGLMGFGGMLAGGCAVGAGVTGGAVLSMTAWVALLSMWLGAGGAIFIARRVTV